MTPPETHPIPLLLATLSTLVEEQRKKLLAEAQLRNPRLTTEDVLQPDDFPELSTDPRYTYEDGVLAGLLVAQVALRATLHELGADPKSPEIGKASAKMEGRKRID